MARPSSLLARPLWLKRLMRLVSGQAGRGYYIALGYGEITYEDDNGVAVVIYADLLTGRPERVLRREDAFRVIDQRQQPVDSQTWTLVTQRVSEDLTRRGISWEIR